MLRLLQFNNRVALSPCNRPDLLSFPLWDLRPCRDTALQATAKARAEAALPRKPNSLIYPMMRQSGINQALHR